MPAAPSPQRRRLMEDYLRRIDNITLNRPGGFPASPPAGPPVREPALAQAEPATPRIEARPRAAPAETPSRRRLWLLALLAAAVAGLWLRN